MSTRMGGGQRGRCYPAQHPRWERSGGMRRIALFGGSFNPPHAGHEAIIRWLTEQPQYESVWVLPVVCHAFGKELEPYAARAALVRALVSSLPRVSVVRRDEVLTAELLHNLSGEYPTFRFDVVLGADILHERHLWHRWAEVAPHALFVSREGYAVPEGVTVHPVAQPPLSSTELRARLARGEPIEASEIPERVQQAIAAMSMYRTPGVA